MTSQTKRAPAVAGSFYPREPEALLEMVDGYLQEAAVEAAPERVACLIVPHAGFIYSGPCAAYAYACVAGDYVKRVVLLGCSHRYPFDGVSIVTAGAFDTPLGPFPIAEDLASRIAERTPTHSTEPHGPEHSLEVQLPFISATLGHVPIVPVLFGGQFSESHRRFSEVLAEELEEGDLVITSTDLSHYLTEKEAQRQDSKSLDLLLAREVDEFVEGMSDGRVSMCGATAVAAAMVYSAQRGTGAWTLLDQRTSAPVSGDYSRVVGYAAVSMEKSA